MRTLALFCWSALFASGCWADFPDSRFDQVDPLDSGVDTVAVDHGPSSDRGPSPDRGPNPDLEFDGPLPDLVLPDGPISCTADEFISCLGTVAVSCNSTGDGTVQANCPLGCSTLYAGCCLDEDGDQQSTCQGDCDDADEQVFAGQDEYFDEARTAGGSFDYNCDQSAEPEYPDLVSCQGGPGKCAGSGWVGTVPACGEEGDFAECVKVSPNCEQQPSETRKQRCR